MNQGFRRAAVGIPGFCAFFNLYGPQSLLPALAQEFDASPAQISLTMTATALAIAISAPFAGAIADVLGRKRVIVAAMIVATAPLIMIALAPSLHALIFWRFMLGPGAAADLHRRGRLYRRGVAARAGDGRDRRLHGGDERRRLLPDVSSPDCSPTRSAGAPASSSRPR